MNDMHAFARQVFASQPFSQFIGAELVALARSAGKRMAICQCEIYALDGESRKLCALAQGRLVPAA